jgi:hypothetical protein
MRFALLSCVLVVACKGDDKKPAAPPPTAVEPAKPADDMDEKMRHCPLTLAGARVTVSDVEGGVQFEIRGTAVDDIRKRARHVGEFAAGRSQAGVHGGGSGGGRMRNCPVVTNGVVIRIEDIEGGARLLVTPSSGGSVDELRRETQARLDNFAFEGVTVARQ